MDPAGRGRCRFFLSAQSGDAGRRYATSLTPWGKAWRPIPDDDREILGFLRVNGLARIGTSRAREILVDVHRGAATRSVQVFRVWRGELRRVWGAGESFTYTGSLGYETGVDSAGARGPGIVVSGGAGLLEMPRGSFYAVERRYYRLHGPRFVALPALTERERVGPETPGRLGAGFTETAFPSCRTTAARAQ